MTFGIVCTVAIGLIALYQTWAARNYREAALLFQKALEDTKRAYDAQRAHQEIANARLQAIADAMPQLQAAGRSGNAMAAHAILAAAFAKSNAIGERTPST